MAFTILEDGGGLNCPEAVCEHCKSRIDKASGANVEFGYSPNRMRVIHKECSIGNQREEYPMWMQLDTYLDFLMENCGYKKCKKADKAESYLR